MKHTHLIILLFLAIAGCVGGETVETSVPYDPSRLGDSDLSEFYIPPADLPSRPGVLIRSEPLAPRQSNAGAAQNLRLLYSATDGLKNEGIRAVSGALFLPAGAPPKGGWPLMAWTHGTVGIADACAPSWNGRQQQDMDYIRFWLEQGYAVVASDYQGLGTPGTHPYLATRPEAYSNLDIIRTVQAGDFPISKKVVLIGQSQGAGAAVATASYAPQYAPELDIRGVVATGVPYFSPQALIALSESRPPDKPDPLLGYNFLAMTLAEQIIPGFVMRDYIADNARPVAAMVETHCYKEIRERVVTEKTTYNQAFKQSPSDALEKAFAQMGFPSLKIGVPIFLGVGGKDRDTPMQMQAAFMRDACTTGTTIEAHFYRELDHRQVVPGSTGHSSPFVRAAFAGEAIEGNCNQSPFG